MLGTLDPHSSFFDPREYAQMRERQEGRYYGLGITISADRRRHHRAERVRGIAGVQGGHPPRRRHREDRAAKTPRAGRREQAHGASCAAAAARRCRSRSAAAATQQPIPLEVDARRGHDPDRARVFHDRRDDRLHPATRTAARTPIATCSARCSDLRSKGMKRLLLDIRDNPGGPLDQAIKVVERVPAARQDDRLHARAHRRIRIRTTARPRTASSPTFRWS